MAFVLVHLTAVRAVGHDMGNQLDLTVNVNGVTSTERIHRVDQDPIQVYNRPMAAPGDATIRFYLVSLREGWEVHPDEGMASGTPELVIPLAEANRWHAIEIPVTITGAGDEEGETETFTLVFKALLAHVVVSVYADAFLPDETVPFPLNMGLAMVPGEGDSVLSVNPGGGLEASGLAGIHHYPAFRVGQTVEGSSPPEDATQYWYHEIEGDDRRESSDTFDTDATALSRIRCTIDLTDHTEGEDEPISRELEQERRIEVGPRHAWRHYYLPSTRTFQRIKDLDPQTEALSKVVLRYGAFARQSGGLLRIENDVPLPFLESMRHLFRYYTKDTGEYVPLYINELWGFSLDRYFHDLFVYYLEIQLRLPPPTDDAARMEIEIRKLRAEHTGFAAHSLVLVDRSGTGFFGASGDQIVLHEQLDGDFERFPSEVYVEWETRLIRQGEGLVP